MPSVSDAEKTLYLRLGGYDVIAAIVDEFSQTFAADPRMVRFVSGMNLERRKRNRQLTVDYLSATTGGSALYLGQDMKTAHAGLEITAGEWQIAMDHIERALAKLNVPSRESKELMAAFGAPRDEIVVR
ncbi:MAG: group I truncated hemoglobin [Candidatus Binataceae bacterium]